MAAEVAARNGNSLESIREMNLPWLHMVYDRCAAAEKRLQASVIGAVNIGYCGSRDRENSRKMQETIEELSNA